MKLRIATAVIDAINSDNGDKWVDYINVYYALQVITNIYWQDRNDATIMATLGFRQSKTNRII